MQVDDALGYVSFRTFFDDHEGSDLALLHESEGVGGEGCATDGERVGVHDVGGGLLEGVGAGALEHASEVAVADDAGEDACGGEDGGHAELFARHLIDDLRHGGIRGDLR